jgi:hypothetical protein
VWFGLRCADSRRRCANNKITPRKTWRRQQDSRRGLKCRVRIPRGVARPDEIARWGKATWGRNFKEAAPPPRSGHFRWFPSGEPAFRQPAREEKSPSPQARHIAPQAPTVRCTACPRVALLSSVAHWWALVAPGGLWRSLAGAGAGATPAPGHRFYRLRLQVATW